MNKSMIIKRRARGECIQCGIQSETFRCPECATRKQQTEAQWRLTVKKQAFDAYGGKCVCCGEDRFIYLQLDHIDGGGSAHRRELRMVGSDNKTTAGAGFYSKMRNQGWPPILQVLCANCHQAKTLYGGCPRDAHGNVS